MKKESSNIELKLNYKKRGVASMWLLPCFVILLLASCTTGKRSGWKSHLVPNKLPDTLKVATLYSPTSYFEYRDEIMGYDYSLVEEFARDKNMQVEWVIASSMNSMLELLDSGYVDLVAYEVPVTSEFLEQVTPCGPENLTYQVLVQKKGSQAKKDVTELIGCDIYVEKDSKYFYRLENLDNELGGGINIHAIDRDTIMPEDLLKMVSDGDISMTVVDSDIAKLNKTYFRDLDITLQLSFPQKSSWGVAPRNSWLGDSVDAWFSSTNPQETNKILLKRYFEIAKNNPASVSSFSQNFKKGYISSYDKLFKRFGKAYGLDWRLLAAIAYAESRFDSTVVSWAGAKGVMQIIPSTAHAFGLNAAQLQESDKNIETASKILSYLDKSLQGNVPDEQERLKFVLAAYNSGLAHIKDAIRIAEAYGMDTHRWDKNVAEALRLKSQPAVYNNKEICKFGYFRGGYTLSYVDNVMELYGKAVSKIDR